MDTFTDVTVQSGLLSFHPTQTGTWADFNNDGWLDVFIGNETSIEQKCIPVNYISAIKMEHLLIWLSVQLCSHWIYKRSYFR